MSTSENEEIFTTWTKEITEDKVSIVYLCGELDASSAPGFLSDMQNLVGSGKNLIMDTHLLSYIDSTGVSAILSTKHALERVHHKLCIVGCHGLLSKILDITRMDREIECYDDIDQAMAELNAGG